MSPSPTIFFNCEKKENGLDELGSARDISFVKAYLSEANDYHFQVLTWPFFLSREVQVLNYYLWMMEEGVKPKMWNGSD